MSKSEKLDAIRKMFGSGADVAEEAVIENHSQIQASKSREVVENIFNLDRTVGFKTGISSLDSLIGGIRLQTCTIVGGETGHGKSLLAINLLVNLTRDEGIPVCYLDLENGSAASFERIMGIWFQRDRDWFKDIKNFNTALEMKKTIDENFSYYSHDELYSMGFAEQGAKLLEKIIRELALKGTKVFLIDPLGAIETLTAAQANFNEQGFFVRKMKDLAQELNIAIIILHHFRKSSNNRNKTIRDSEIDEKVDVKYRMPSEEDLNGSGKISHFATDVWLIFRPNKSTDQVYRTSMLLIVAKNRNGMPGEVKLKLNEETFRIKERSEWESIREEMERNKATAEAEEDLGQNGLW